MVGRPTRRYGRGRESISAVQEGSGDPPRSLVGLVGPPRGPGGVKRSYRRSKRRSWRFWRGREAYLKDQEGSGGPREGPEWVGRPSVGPGGVGSFY